MSIHSTFFGLVVQPSFQCKTLLKDTLLLTRAVIDPEASANAAARLILAIDKSKAPLCDLDGRDVLSVPLNIQLFPGVEIVFTVQGNCPIHVSGFYEPCVEQIDREPFAAARILQLSGGGAN
jgi:hypothetical protein